MFKCDYHTHSCYSPDADSSATIDALCRAAMDRGITDLAITDHFEANMLCEYGEQTYRADEAYAELSKAKEKYRGKLNLAIGIEIGQGNQYPEEARRLLASHNYEFVIGSIHNLTASPDFFYINFKGLLEEAPTAYLGFLFERYLDELSAVIDALPQLDTLAHLTYMRRYCVMAGHDYDFSRHADKLETLFQKMIGREIALEVNLSTFWKGLGFTMPDRDLLGIYRACGGRLITVGSDAHSPTHVGDGLDHAFSTLRDLGLNQILVVRDGNKTTVEI